MTVIEFQGCNLPTDKSEQKLINSTKSNSVIRPINLTPQNETEQSLQEVHLTL